MNNCPRFHPDEKKLINLKSIRVGTNFTEYSFDSVVTKEQRNEIEKKAIAALSKFTDELTFKYFSLES